MLQAPHCGGDTGWPATVRRRSSPGAGQPADLDSEASASSSSAGCECRAAAGGGGPGAAAAGPHAAAAAALPDNHMRQHKLVLNKALTFPDSKLEAAFRVHLAEERRGDELWHAALRVLLWSLAASKLASAGAHLAALQMALACVLPELGQAALLVGGRPMWKGRHSVLAAVLQLASDLFGFVAIQQSHGLALVPNSAHTPGPLRHVLEFSFQAAAYLAFSTLRTPFTFVVQFGTATAILVAQVCAVRALWGSVGAADSWHQLLPLAALSLAYSVPLCTLYTREVRQRTAFASRHGRAVVTDYVDPFAPVSFVSIGMAQAIMIWSWLG